MSFVRSSKYRHIFGQAHKNIFSSIKITKVSGDGLFSSVNPKFLAVILDGAGGGPFLVWPVDKCVRIPTDQKFVNGHKEKVLDIAWSPFNDNMIASASEDCTVKIWEIPDEILTEELNEPWVTLSGHEKKVYLLQWHPSAEYILASAAQDSKIIIWNCEEGESLYVIDLGSPALCISWNWNGSLLAATCRDKSLRVIDVRKEEIVQEKANIFDGKSCQCVFLKDGKIFLIGFSKTGERVYSVWNSKKLDEPLAFADFDCGSGSLLIHYDPDNNVVFLSGKGENQIIYFEITNQEPYVHFLSKHTTSTSTRGGAWMPKRGLDLTTHEIARYYRLIPPDKCEPVSLIVPRKSELFQEDIYPPCVSDEPALTASEWAEGKNADPKTMSLKEEFKQKGGSKGNKPKRVLKKPTGKSGKSDNSEEYDLAQLVGDMKKMQETLNDVCERLKSLEKKIGK